MSKNYTICVLILSAASMLVGQGRVDDMVIPAGEVHEGDITPLQGNVQVDTEARVKGRIETINGDIYLDPKARVGEIKSLNGDISIDNECIIESVETEAGDIDIGRKAKVHGDLKTKRGDITIEEGTEVTGKIEVDEGEIELEGVHVHGDLVTHQGDVVLMHGTEVDGDIIVQAREESLWGSGNWLEIFVGDLVTVQGDIRAPSLRDSVRVVIAGGRVQGQLRNVVKIMEGE